MKISYNWLQKYFKEKLPEPTEIANGIIFHSFEVEEIENIGDDTIFEIKILPDRAHDCLSHFGIAKEISAIFEIKLESNLEDYEEKIENISKSDLEIKILDDNCRRYMGRVIKGVKVGPSPEWLAKSLVSIGQKSINNIVDATNYIMFDLGNPIHAFDLDKLASHKIIIDKAITGEKLTLLDGKEVTLDESILTIRDEKEALVVAGVKGGKKAEVDNNTTNIMIEVANFEPISTRKSAKKLGIFTDSLKRFENEIPVSLIPVVMGKITSLIIDIAGGEICEIVDIQKQKDEIRRVLFTEKYLKNMLGVSIESDLICNILDRLGYNFKKNKEEYEVEIPFLRLDINGPHDMVEEIGRIYGYQNITPVLPEIIFKKNENKEWNYINIARNYLVSLGYKEVMTYAFSNNGDIELMASASDKNFLRINLANGIKKSFELNKLNLSFLGDKEIKIFEIGKVFPKGQEVMNVCFADKKEIKEFSLEKFVDEIKNKEEFNNKNIKENSITGIFKAWSLYPFITRDIAVWLPGGEDQKKLENIFVEEGTDLLIKEPYLFDQFTKEDRTSFAYRLVFQSYDRTLTDEEITSIMSKINEKIISLGWEIR